MGAAASVLEGAGQQLLKAAKSGDTEVIVELISARPELLFYATYRQMTPAHFAAREDHTEVLQQLFSKAQEVQHDISLRGGKHMASQDLVRQLVNACTDRGVTPLMLAVDKGCLATVKLLLQKGADPWAVDKLGGRTALHYASRRNNVEVIHALLEAAGDVPGPVRFPNRPNTRLIDVRTQTGFTALHYAVHAVAQQALAALLNHGANPLMSSMFNSLECINCPSGSTPLHVAARYGNTDAALQLLKAYAEQWRRRDVADPRLVPDGDNSLPYQLTTQFQNASLFSILLPTTSLASLFQDEQLAVIGLPSLAVIAGAVLRNSLMQELQAVEGQAPGPLLDGYGAAGAKTALTAAAVGSKTGNVDAPGQV